MKLYYFPGACSLADHIVLEWTGARYEAIRMSHSSIKTPAYLALNAQGSVPLLIDGDFSLTENVAILGYLADQYPRARLLGDGTLRGRAEVMRWLAFLNSDVHGAFKPLFSPSRFLPDPTAAPALADAARFRVREYLRRLNAQIENANWLTGERSVADPYLFVMLRWAIRLKIDLDGFGNLQKFLDHMQKDAGVRAAINAEEDALPTVPHRDLART